MLHNKVNAIEGCLSDLAWDFPKDKNAILTHCNAGG